MSAKLGEIRALISRPDEEMETRIRERVFDQARNHVFGVPICLD